MKIAGLTIKGITSNSKDVKNGFAFVAIKGNRQDGSDFIKEAIGKGAKIVVIQKDAGSIKLGDGIKLLKVKDCRKFLAESSAQFYGFPSQRLKVTGITGTNGKTTITYLIEAILKQAGADCGVIGTINYRFKNKTFKAQNTTPASFELQGLFLKMLDSSVKYCAMEVSSHALDQDRVAGINFNSAIFTNLTQDHLDYHRNFENYFLAKAKLFRNLASDSFAIINNDDKYGRRIKNLSQAKIITYGIKNKSIVTARDITFNIGSTEFTLTAPKIETRVKTNLVGIYNVYNILAAICWALSQNLKINDIKNAIAGFKNVPGRLEKIKTKSGNNIFIDYAHTPDALYNVISCLKKIVKGRLIVIFGCGGDRDKLKRPKMGKIATSLADYVIITSDNPRSEEPGEIIKDIKKGASGRNYYIECDRFKAICKGLAMLETGDCLLIAGKGHESYQIVNDKVFNFNDGKEVRKCLVSMK